MTYDGFVVGQNIRDLRKKNKLTIDEFGEVLQVSSSHLNQIELGARPMTLNLMYKIMTEFHVDANLLLGIVSVKDKEAVEYSIDDILDSLTSDAKADLFDSFQFSVREAVSGRSR